MDGDIEERRKNRRFTGEGYERGLRALAFFFLI